MTTKKLITTALFISTMAQMTYANEHSQKIVYGDDNRVETYEASKRDQMLAKSTAGMLSTVEAIDLGDAFMLPPKSIQESMGLCKDERFADQPTAVSCSGFLVGPDLLVTAGHCVTTQERCDEVSFVFDYKLDATTKKAAMIVDKDSVYKCKKVIDAKLERIEGSIPVNQRDYALVKLDRVVKGKSPLNFRTTGMVDNKDGLVVIGHPSGLPQKVAPGANIFKNNTKLAYFETNLDTFGGNSGSAVFNNQTGVVEGILVRGAKDYIKNDEGGCIEVNRVQEDITGVPNLGESVSRITDIPTLKYRAQYMKAAAEGNVAELAQLLEKGVDLNITDNFNNTALHMAAGSQNLNAVKFLIEKGIELEVENLAGLKATQMRKKGIKAIKLAINAAIENRKK